MKLKAWPNGLGYDFGKWELMRQDDGTWSAVYRPGLYAVKAGTGASYQDAILNAKGVTPAEKDALWNVGGEK